MTVDDIKCQYFIVLHKNLISFSKMNEDLRFNKSHIIEIMFITKSVDLDNAVLEWLQFSTLKMKIST